MVEIIPAIMPYSYTDLEEKCNKVSKIHNWAQIDVMDGIFVSSKSWPYDTEMQEEFHHIMTGESSLPESASISYIADLMVSDPEISAYTWSKVGVSRIVLHIESLSDKTSPDFIIQLKKDTELEIGLSINTTTSPDVILPFLDFIDDIQCMGIEKIGYQAQNFDPRVIDNIKYIRNHNINIPITVDGSVNKDTIPLLVDAGATRLVVGSALFGSGDIKKTYQELKKLI